MNYGYTVSLDAITADCHFVRAESESGGALASAYIWTEAGGGAGYIVGAAGAGSQVGIIDLESRRFATLAAAVDGAKRKLDEYLLRAGELADAIGEAEALRAKHAAAQAKANELSRAFLPSPFAAAQA